MAETTTEKVQQKESKSHSVAVVGAGLVGCLAALALAAKGHTVTIYELRKDPRKEKAIAGLRLINLAVSDRGIRALKYADPAMAERVLAHVIPMHGRMIHDTQGKQTSQEYGLFGESINSIDRAFLNKVLLEEVEKAGVSLRFEHKLARVGAGERPLLEFKNGQEAVSHNYDFVIGADGAHSAVRSQMQRLVRMDYSQTYIDMQYLELHIPANKDSEDRFSISPNHLHIWPRHDHMLIALANQDGSFTSTFFSPWRVMEEISSGEAFGDFFEANFPDAYELMGRQLLVQAFETQPRGALMQVEAYPYHTPNGRVLIVGDAAHSMVPFYGQGMNCGFEDVHVLMKLIEDGDGDIAEAFKAYSPARKDDLRAICRLAMANYHEMLSRVTSPIYLLRKLVDRFLGVNGDGRWWYSWIPLYTMVSFRGDIRYLEAVEIERRQGRILTGLQVGATVALLAAVAAKTASWWGRS